MSPSRRTHLRAHWCWVHECGVIVCVHQPQFHYTPALSFQLSIVQLRPRCLQTIATNSSFCSRVSVPPCIIHACVYLPVLPCLCAHKSCSGNGERLISFARRQPSERCRWPANDVDLLNFIFTCSFGRRELGNGRRHKYTRVGGTCAHTHTHTHIHTHTHTHTHTHHLKP